MKFLYKYHGELINWNIGRKNIKRIGKHSVIVTVDKTTGITTQRQYWYKGKPLVADSFHWIVKGKDERKRKSEQRKRKRATGAENGILLKTSRGPFSPPSAF